ncbi:MAG: hypothetical protein NTZ20_01255 [Candidatus Levybacteria bacterium]|nr:hypothetical protein [Candidatus Levybacteria bacterium]
MKHILGLYLAFLLALVLFSYGFVDVNFIYLQSFYTGIFTQNRELSAIIYALMVIVSFFWYWLFLRSVENKKISDKLFIKIIGITVGILLFTYPAMLSFDIFNYTTTSKVLYLYKENPYITMPIEFSNDEFLQYTRAANKVALYGPLWILITGIPYIFNSISFLSSLLVMKVIVAVCYLGIGYLIWRFTKNMYSVALFLLNPLVIIETLISSHNDSVMMLLVLGSYFLLSKKKIFYGMVVFMASVLVKYVSIVLLPVILFLIWQQVTKKNIQWERVFLISLVLMTLVFFTAPIREEIYPWYWIWVLPFVSLLYKNNFIRQLAIIFSLSLLLRYIPVLYTGSYFGYTPHLKILFTFIPPILYVIFYILRRRFVN